MSPKWTELNEKISEFEKKADNAINQKVQGIQSQHPLVHRFIKATINSVLPFPVNEIARSIYDSSSSAGGSELEAVLKIKRYFEVLQNSGEENYNKISSQLNDINEEIFNSRIVCAKESTITLLKETLVSNQDTILDEIENLKSQLNQTHIEIGDISGDAIGVGVTGNGNTIFKASNVFINEVKQHSGLSLIESNYFDENRRTDENFNQWREGFEFKLPSIYYGREYRRNRVLNEIGKRLESQHKLLLLGESGTSKSTLLMEMICDYFDMDYKILYSDGTQAPSSVDGIIGTIKGLVNAGNKVMVAVDNVHDNKMAIIFYIIDQLQSFNNISKIRFLLAARQPEYNTLVTSGIFSEKVKDYKDSILSFRDKELKYELTYFTLNEIIDFINKYKEYTNIIDVKQKAIEIFEDTKGHSIMVKFSVLGGGLRTSVESLFGRYLTVEDGTGKPDHNKIVTTMICSLFHISTLNITNDELEKLKFNHKTNALSYTNDLNKAILVCENGIWKTLHVRWALELVSFLFDHYKENTNVYTEIKRDFQESLDKIYENFDEMTVLYVLNTIYNTIAIGKYVCIEVINETVKVPMSFTNNAKCDLYALVKGVVLGNLSRYDEAIKCYDKALEIDGKHVGAWNNKGYALYSLDKYPEAMQYFDKVLEIDSKHVNAWNNKGNALCSLGRYDEAIRCYDEALKIDGKYVDAWDNKGYTLAKRHRYNEAIEYFDKALEIDGKYAGAWYNKGTTLSVLGRYNEAIECFDKALEIDSNYANAYYNRACSKCRLNRVNECLDDLKMAITLDENNIESAKKDEDFNSIKDNEEFKRLLSR